MLLNPARVKRQLSSEIVGLLGYHFFPLWIVGVRRMPLGDPGKTVQKEETSHQVAGAGILPSPQMISLYIHKHNAYCH